MLFLTVLFIIVLVLLLYAMSADKGKHTVYARKSAQSSAVVKPAPLSLSKEQQPGAMQTN